MTALGAREYVITQICRLHAFLAGWDNLGKRGFTTIWEESGAVTPVLADMVVLLPMQVSFQAKAAEFYSSSKFKARKRRAVD